MAFTTMADMETAAQNTKLRRTATGAVMADPVQGVVELPDDDSSQELPVGTKVEVTDTSPLTFEVSVPIADGSVVVNEVTTVDEIVGDLDAFKTAFKTPA